MSSRFSRNLPRRVFAGFAALSLAAVGLTAVSGAAQASDNKVIRVGASVDGGVANVGVLTTVNFTITNASKSSSLRSFTIVLPPGIAAAPGKNSPTALGITGGGNWSEKVTSCGTVPSCSWLVVAEGLLPRSTSLVRPGVTLTASVGFVPTAAGPLSFKVIRIENDDFTTPDSPSITVQNALPGSFCVQEVPQGNVAAGSTARFTVQAIKAGSETGSDPCTGTATSYPVSKSVELKLNTDDGAGAARIAAVAPVSGSGDGTATAAATTSPSDITFTFTTSTSGKFNFDVTLKTAAGNQSLTAAELAPSTVAGTSYGFAVLAGPATQIVLTSVLDHANPVVPATPTTPVALTAGAQFDATFVGADAYGNPTDVAAGRVTLNVGGTGTFTPVGPSSASTVSLAQEGIVSGSYNKAGSALPITLTLAGTSLSPDPTSNALPADFAAANVGTAVFVPGGSGTIQTSNYGALTADGVPSCTFDSVNPACVGVSLPNGAQGTVTLGLEDCATAGTTAGQCATSTDNVVAHLTADLKRIISTPSGPVTQNLYSPAAPASLTYVCPATKCAWDTADDNRPPYNAWEESVEAFNHFPVYGQDASQIGSADESFYKVPACQSDLNPNLPDPQPAATQVPSPGKKSCVDVASLLRNTDTASPSYGSLSFTILYWDDYKMVP